MFVGVIIRETVFGAWWFRREHRIITWSATLALAVLPVQVVVGRFTVTALLEPIVVTAHLGTTIIIVLALTVTTVSAWLYDQSIV